MFKQKTYNVKVLGIEYKALQYVFAAFSFNFFLGDLPSFVVCPENSSYTAPLLLLLLSRFSRVRLCVTP